MSKSYRQFCGLARALDLVGDRWNLLIVRQLLLGPARFGQLRDGLPSIASNLLAQRVRELETAGVIERRLADRGNAVVYALTAWGEQLREPIEGLIRWSTPLMALGPREDEFRPEWLFIALPALLRGRVSARRSVRVGIEVDGETAALQVARSRVEITVHEGGKLDAVLRAEPAVLLGIAAGVLRLDDLRSALDIEGDEDAVRIALGA